MARMRLMVSATALVLCLSGRSFAASPNWEEIWSRCRTAVVGSRIAACTLIIESRQASAKNLASAFDNRGRAHRANRDWALALQDFNRALELDSTDVVALNNRALTYGEMADWGNATADFERAVKIRPDYAVTFNNWGVVLEKSGSNVEAVAKYTEALNLESENPVYYFNRAHSDRLIGDYSNAISDSNAAIRLRPEYAEALFERGNVYRLRSDWVRAVADYDEAMRLSARAPAFAAMLLVNRAAVLESSGDHERALTDYADAIKRYDLVVLEYPNEAMPLYGRGIAKLHAGDQPGARADMAAAVRMDAKIPDIAKNTGLAE